MRSAKRIRFYKILAGVIFGVIVFVLVAMIVDSYSNFDDHSFEQNQKTNERNNAFAKTNPFGFTDRLRTAEKPKGIFRIAVLGDSFIWGDGLPYEQAWGHKLAAKLTAKYDSVEVLN